VSQAGGVGSCSRFSVSEWWRIAVPAVDPGRGGVVGRFVLVLVLVLLLVLDP
jgi:hypothetical protein